MAVEYVNGIKLEQLSGVFGSLFTRFKSTSQIFCFLVLTFIFLRSILGENDPYKCGALLNSGQWHGRDWIVPGCTSIQHDRDQIKICTGEQKRKIVIAGDLQLQGLYWGFMKRFDSKLVVPTLEGKDLKWEKDNLELHFNYDPHLNGTALHTTIESIRDESPDQPLMTIIGAGNYAVANGSIEEYALTVRSLASVAHAKRSHSKAGSMITHQDGPGDLLLFAPAQEPYTEASTINPKVLPYRRLNDQLDQLVSAGLVDVPTSFLAMTTGHRDMYMDEDLHLKDTVYQRRAEVLYNLRCNAKVASTGQFPNRATCCARWRAPNWIQFIFLTYAFVVSPVLVFFDWRSPFLSERSRPVVHAVAAFTGVIGLQYVADRSHIFEQAQRFPFDMRNHRLFIFVAFAIGLATIRRSKLNVKPTPEVPKPSQPYLPRDQTDEWKGWMQLLIIFYHYNSANTYPRFWVLIRLCVSSYLFLTGFGHAVFFLQKKDYSLKRFTNVMIRTNLLPCTLAYVMRTRWLLYYYMPLSTFWFVVVYATFTIGSKYNDNRALLLGKLAVSCMMINLFLSIHGLPSAIFEVITYATNMSFDADGFFHHRVGQDRYIPYVGMALAPFYIFLKDSLVPNKRQDRLSQVVRKVFPWAQYIVVGVCAVAMVAWWNWMYNGVLTGGPFAFPPWQPYVTFVPILAFTVLRNAHPVLRNFHSVVFAWLGRYSGEMYVMQDHLWLSADQESVLRTGFFRGDETVIGDRWRDLVLLTPVYLLACSIVGDATGVIANWFIADPPNTPSKSQQPQSEAEMGLLAPEDGEIVNGFGLSEKYSPRRLSLATVIAWPSRLQYRICILLAVMWFLNKTYT